MVFYSLKFDNYLFYILNTHLLTIIENNGVDRKNILKINDAHIDPKNMPTTV